MSALRDLRARLGPPPRDLVIEIAAKKPEWAAEDPMGAVWEQAGQIARQGTAVLAWVMMANSKLWGPGEDDHPAGLVYSFDDACAYPPQLLEPVSNRLFAMHKSAPNAVGPSARPWTRAVHDQVYTGFERPIHEALPPDMTGGPVMYHTSVILFREHLLDRYLHSSVVPLLVDRRGTGMALSIPPSLWPDSVHRLVSRTGY